MKLSEFKKEFEKYATSTEALNGIRIDIERTSKDDKLLAARAAKEEAQRQYTRNLNRCVMADKEYIQLQRQVVTIAVHEFAANHNCKGFAKWYDDNGKDEQTTVIDSCQRLLSHVVRLYKQYKAGNLQATKERKEKLSRAEQIAALQTQLAALQAQED